MQRIHLALAALLMGAVLATPAHALYMQTPLLLSGPDHADVGDEVTFDVHPENASAAARFAGQTVRLVYSFDANESADAPASQDRQEIFLAEVALDDAARGSFQWTVPAEVQDHNVDIAIVSGDERLAFAFLAVGDAPPAMHILAASGPGEPLENEHNEGEKSEDAPGIGLLAGIVVVGAVLALRRR